MSVPTGALALLLASSARAGDSQAWTGSSATIRLSDQWSLSQDITARFSDKRGGLYDLEANTLVGRQLVKGMSLWLGYDHNPQYEAGHFSVMEHRFVQHLVFSDLGTLFGGRLSGRVRLEQRWRDGVAGTGWRVRPYLRYSLPLGRTTKAALVASGEPFFDLSTTRFQPVRGLERLRSFAGISLPLAQAVSVDLGYLNQHGFVRMGADTDDNVAFLSIALKL